MSETGDGPRRVAYVLPVYNEADGVREFHRALVEATSQRTDLDFEFGYYLILALMGGICGLLYWRFRRAGWL